MPLRSGNKALCFVFLKGLSNTRIIAGRTVRQQTTPSSTPLAMTMPRSRPSVKLMKHKAIKPAIVVTEEPITLDIVSSIACAIAFSLSSVSAYFS